MRVGSVLLLLVGCGRIGIEPADRAVVDAVDAVDAVVSGDAVRVCPADTSPISMEARACIEKTERGTQTWTDSVSKCAFLGRRLCSDAEWATACEQATALVDMANDADGANWEWVSDLLPNGEGAKRGLTLCTDTSSHEISVDPYDFRCCVDI